MSIKNIFITLRLIPALLLLSGAPAIFADQPLVKEMAAFDQAYIAALALSNQNKAEATAKAMITLDAQWKAFLASSADAYPGDGQWRAGLDKVGAVIAKAAAETQAGKIAAVHETLEEVRAIFVGLRGDRKVEYFIDFLNHYHEVMEQAAAVASGKNESTFTSTDLKAVAEIMPTLQAAWKNALGAEFDRESYLVSEAKVEEIRKAMQGTQASIDKLAAAVESGKIDQAFAALNALKPAFTKSFLMFGKFES